MPCGSLLHIYSTLLAFFGEQGWWPAETAFEVVVGAILTQNAAWRNVERAIENLKLEEVLTPESLIDIEEGMLARLVRPVGYYNVKARRVKNFMDFLSRSYEGSLEKMFNEPLYVLRDKILAVKGIGQETADSILLYAGRKPVFVVDTYTKRILLRHKMIADGASYREIQNVFMDNLPLNVPLFQEYHALLVMLGKTFCRTEPSCQGCPLEG